MPSFRHLYIFNYDYNVKDLCLLEVESIFNTDLQHKLLFSDLTFNPSHSAFIKKRIDIITTNENYDTLIQNIKDKQIHIEGFKVEYEILEGDPTAYKDRLNKLREIGHSISGEAQYTNPIITYSLSFYNNVWYFGELIKNDFDWHNHKQKPHSFSNSLDMGMAKALVNIAAKGNKSLSVLDACCGVGTIMLEGCFAEYNMTGSDINPKICSYVKINLTHFNYSATIINSDIADISTKYDTAIIDLPYNLFTKVSHNINEHIITSTAQITDRLVIVSTINLSDLINQIGFSVKGKCSVTKKGKANFTRHIWVCEKNNI